MSAVLCAIPVALVWLALIMAKAWRKRRPITMIIRIK